MEILPYFLNQVNSIELPLFFGWSYDVSTVLFYRYFIIEIYDLCPGKYFENYIFEYTYDAHIW